jgi:TPR repeat protein
MNHSVYEGKKPYIYISYAHKDIGRVTPLIRELQDRGFRLWYDTATEVGQTFIECIVERMKNATCMVVFLSRVALESQNCRHEIHYALDQNIPVVVVYMDEVNMPAGMKLLLSTSQFLLRQRYANDTDLMAALAEIPILQPCYRPLPDGLGKDAAERALIRGHHSRLDEESVYWYRIAAEDGNTSGMWQMGNAYQHAHGVPKDYQKALYWYQVAAERGDIRCYSQIGWMYKKDLNNAAEAFRWYRIAVEKGDAYAMETLAKCYLNGDGVARNEELAAHWYLKAAQAGCNSRECFYQIAQFYMKGIPEKNEQKAIYWYQKAADLNYGPAFSELGKCYQYGRGVSPDISLAVLYYKDGADLFDDAESMCCLGRCYQFGIGVVPDMKTAIEWYRKAAGQGFENAIEYLHQLGLGS